MSSFLPVDVNKISTLVSNVTQSLPPTLSQAVGNALPVGQIGSSTIVNNLQRLANQVVPGAGSLIQQQSAFPYKKQVSFMLLDRNGAPLATPAGNNENFQPGYFFKMFVNPSNFSVTLPPKTIVPVRTLGGWKMQHWYPDIGSIRADGIIGNMLERFNRDLKDSTAWRQFQKLVTVYQQNGVPYSPPGSNNANRQSLQALFAPTAVCIYDRVRYDGYFESFEYTESEETPHTVRYGLNFRFLQYMDLADIPGITRSASVDASVLNAIIPQSRVNQVQSDITKMFSSIKL
jgi:hypothetical protein